MAQALFITRQDLVQNSMMSGNIDTDKFIQFIKIAQDVHIQNFLGTDLYNKIKSDIVGSSLSGNYQTLVNDYIKPCLIHYAMTDYLPFSAFQLANGGLFKLAPEGAETIQASEIERLTQKHRDWASFYTKRLIAYLKYNTDLFPEYLTNTESDMKPDKDTAFINWVL